ncbi:MAG: outer membrane lipoprotein-sorting protein [Desulfobacter sp.]|nr:outer membrane lipoprotein-sorting protein [Desulfobacter sp.]
MKKILGIIWVIILVFSSPVPAEETDAKALIARAWDHMRGTTSVSVVHMTVHRSDWERKSTIKAWTKGRKNSIFQILAPKKDKGNGTLKLGPDMWTFNPKINRIIKIPPSMMSQSWMGSDFSNNDLSKADSILNDYTHKIVETNKVLAMTVYTIKALPKPQAPVIWGMQTLKIRKDGILLEQSFHDEDMAPVKIMTTDKIADIGGRPFPAQWTMRSVDAESKEDYTLLEYEDLKFDIPLKKNLFTINALKHPLR